MKKKKLGDWVCTHIYKIIQFQSIIPDKAKMFKICYNPYHHFVQFSLNDTTHHAPYIQCSLTFKDIDVDTKQLESLLEIIEDRYYRKSKNRNDGKINLYIPQAIVNLDSEDMINMICNEGYEI